MSKARKYCNGHIKHLLLHRYISTYRVQDMTLTRLQLAKAGFYYKPTSTNPDNATCYLCHCNLDGWEEEDDPIAEHLKHSPSCGWANTASIEQAIENGERDLEDPASEKLMDARAMTFGSTWPHESKRGWVCKTQKVRHASQRGQTSS